MEDSTLLNTDLRKRRSSLRNRIWVRKAAVAIMAGAIFFGVTGTITLIVLSQDLPQLNKLDDYRPMQSTVVYGRKGEIVARFAQERRTVIPYDRIPKIMVDSVIAAEDDQFFEHTGLDWVGILRCTLKNTFSGKTRCGASTITQQTVKTFFLTPERTYKRKLKEMILAKRVEDALTKKDILYLYLNQIYFGHGAYGVQEATRIYFGKDARDLTVAEAALLAGLPQSPGRLDPYKNPDRAIARRSYVLNRLRTLAVIDEATFKTAEAAPIELDYSLSESDIDSNNHYAAHVRKLLEEMPNVGPEKTMGGGLKVYTGLDPHMQRAAEIALSEGLRSLDKRQGWRGPMLHVERNDIKALSTMLDARMEKLGSKKTSTTGPTIWDLSRLDTREKKVDLERLARSARFPKLKLEKVYGGIVTTVDDPGKEAIVSLGPAKVHLPLRTGLTWARRFDIARQTARPRSASDVLEVGDIVLVRPTALRKGQAAEYIGMLEQDPLAQSSLVVIEPSSREVRALVGGYGIGAGTFNRALQARRQAGSTFKPFVYAAAFETERYTPITKCLDAPRVYRDPWTKRSWKPENYEGTFDGELTLRTALTLSKNMCSVELIDKIEVNPVLDLAKRVGIDSPLPRNLTLGLGSGDVTPLEITNAYATLATGGRYEAPAFIRKVVGPDGEVLFEAKHEPKDVLRPEVAYLTTSLMQSVVEDGTARAVTVLKRPVAGKTGTTNEARNAWFIGYTPDLVAGVWVGFDNNDPLGPGETGGRAAIPIWLEFMKHATASTKVNEFVVPPGIVFAMVDPKTGKLTTPEAEGAKNEPFLSGTEPSEFGDGGETPGVLPWPDY